MKKQASTKRKYWYFFYHDYCPVCGRSDDYKERRYTSKPEKYEERHYFKESYDYCVE